MASKIIGIRFTGNNKIYHFSNPMNHPFHIGEQAVVIGRDGEPHFVIVASVNKQKYNTTKGAYPLENRFEPIVFSNNPLPPI